MSATQLWMWPVLTTGFWLTEYGAYRSALFLYHLATRR